MSFRGSIKNDKQQGTYGVPCFKISNKITYKQMDGDPELWQKPWKKTLPEILTEKRESDSGRNVRFFSLDKRGVLHTRTMDVITTDREMAA